MKPNTDPKSIEEVLAEFERIISTHTVNAATAETPESERYYIGAVISMQNAQYLVEKLKDNLAVK